MYLFWGVIYPGVGFLVAQLVRNLPAMWEIWVHALGWEDPLEEGTATHSSILAWRISADRGTWRGTVHGVAEGNMTEGLSTHTREWGSPGGTEVKNLPANVGGTRDAGFIPRLVRSPEVGNGI